MGDMTLVMACMIAMVAINHRLFSRLRPPARKRWLLLFLAVALSVYCVSSFNGMQGLKTYLISQYGDTSAYAIQAKMMLHGILRTPSPQPPEFFSTVHCVNTGSHYFGKYPPGWPAVLALGIAARIPWILNPFLTVAGLYVLFHLGRKLYDEMTAWTALILASFTFLTVWAASSYFSEPLAFFTTCAFVYCAVTTLENGKAGWALGCGASLGLLVITRPQTALTVAIPVGLFWLWKLIQGERRLGNAFVVCAAVLPFLAILLSYNAYLTGSPLHFPHSLYNANDRMGFGLRARDIGDPLVYFGPGNFLHNLLLEMVLPSLGTLPLCFVFLGILMVSPKKGSSDGLILFTVAVVTLFYGFSFVWQTSTRYHWPTCFALALGSARGLELVFGRLFGKHPKDVPQQLAFICAILFTAFYILTTTLPWIKADITNDRLIADPMLTIERAHLPKAIVFIRTIPVLKHGSIQLVPRLYTQNAPDFTGPVLIALDLGVRNRELAARHPDRACYVYDFDPREGRGHLTPLDRGGR